MSRSTATIPSELALSRGAQFSLPIRLAPKSHPSAQPTTLARQQQNDIEYSKFEHVKLTLWNLPELNIMTVNNRAQVKRISLSLQFEGKSAHLWEGSYRGGTDNCIFTTAMHDLFSLLSSWAPQGKLNLEIEITSPSREPPDSSLTTSTPASADQVILDNNSGVFFNETYEQYWWESLPEAPAITNLVVKALPHRAWKPATLESLVSRLPNLEEFRYENVPQDPAAEAIPIHHNPSYSPKRWSSVLRHHHKIHDLYYWGPSHLYSPLFLSGPYQDPFADD